MTEIKVKNKDIVVPGDKLVEGMDILPGYGTYREAQAIYAERIGVVKVDGRTVKLIPLSGAYVPQRDDLIIAKVFNISMNGWNVETNSAYPAMLSLRDGSSDYIQRGADLSKYHSIGDYILCGVTNVTSQMLIDVTMKGPGLMKLTGGRVIKVDSNKVPRIIGKQGSMVGLIKEKTGCKISVGQNGLVWISGKPDMELLAQNTIKKIEAEAHIAGLTEAIGKFLDEQVKVKA
jgi:exosome complex component RRP4